MGQQILSLSLMHITLCVLSSYFKKRCDRRGNFICVVHNNIPWRYDHRDKNFKHKCELY